MRVYSALKMQSLLNNFIKKISKDSKLPKIKNIQIKPKYIVQIDSNIPRFKVFINSKKKAPNLFIRYFDNEFRKYFSLNGIPINIKFISSVLLLVIGGYLLSN